jgi:hypothetical protein
LLQTSRLIRPRASRRAAIEPGDFSLQKMPPERVLIGSTRLWRPASSPGGISTIETRPSRLATASVPFEEIQAVRAGDAVGRQFHEVVGNHAWAGAGCLD